MRSSDRFHRVDANEFNVMVIGVPNVGKSCLINRLRQDNVQAKGNATKVGASAGVTTSVMQKIRVCHSPPIFVFDTPGVLAPGVRNPEDYLKLGIVCMCCDDSCSLTRSNTFLAVSASLSDETVGVELIADYLLYWLNREQKFNYVNYFKLDEPSDNISEVLFKIALEYGNMRKVRLASGKSTKRENMSFCFAI